MKKYSLNFIEIPISLGYEKTDTEFIIIFSYNKRLKNLRFIKDKRYLVYDSFEKKIIDKSIRLPGFEFVKRLDYDDKICLIYNYNKIPDILYNKYKGIFIVSGWVPPNAGCEYCKYYEKQNDILFHCEVKNKNMINKIKNCKVFMQDVYK